MIERETLIGDIVRRAFLTPTVKRVVRNPAAAPAAADCPIIHVVELEDTVKGTSRRGDAVLYTREIVIGVEFFIVGTSLEAANSELSAFVSAFKKELYRDGINLGGVCQQLVETDASPFVALAGGAGVRGTGIRMIAQYIENIGNLYV